MASSSFQESLLNSARYAFITDLPCGETNSGCQELWSIESGVEETSKTRNVLPVEVSQELDRRIRQVSEEFSVLAQMVNKCEF